MALISGLKCYLLLKIKLPKLGAHNLLGNVGSSLWNHGAIELNTWVLNMKRQSIREVLRF
jgi:hypothetical protein